MQSGTVTCSRCSAKLPEEDALLCPHCAAAMLLALDGEAGTSPDAAEQFAIAIQGYTIHSYLGGGGMGRVYRATRDTDGLEVAVKVLNGSCYDSPLLRDRFRTEVEASRSRNH